MFTGKCNAGCQCQMSGFMNWITVNAAAYSRKRNTLQALLCGQLQAVFIGAGEQSRFTVRSVAVDGADGVDDMPGFEIAAGGDYGFACGAAADDAALGHNGGSSGAVNGPVNAGAAREPAVGGIDNGVRVFTGDITNDKLDEGLIELSLHVFYPAEILLPSP